jgi:hypothetical protein
LALVLFARKRVAIRFCARWKSSTEHGLAYALQDGGLSPRSSSERA